jgi:hypothetical protein
MMQYLMHLEQAVSLTILIALTGHTATQEKHREQSDGLNKGSRFPSRNVSACVL